ncbi:MAG: T9SS type A sorting domain-containing protein [Bacteroidetes bacterium]|nr:T9SS type A sorting domain-containing protein [Bacteroidota bacterium]
MKKAYSFFFSLFIFLGIQSAKAQDCQTLYGQGYSGTGSSIGVRSFDYTTNTWGASSLENTTYFHSPNTIKDGGPIAIDPLNQNINIVTDQRQTIALFTFGSAPSFIAYPSSLNNITAFTLCSGYKPASHICYYMTQNFLSASPTPAGTGFYSIDFTDPANPVGNQYTAILATGAPFLNTNGGGDICFDASGTGYIITSAKQLYTVVTDESAMTATFTYINTLNGLGFTPTAIAFDPVHLNSLTITGTTQDYTNFDLSTNTLTVLTNAAGWVAPDLASCVFPNMSPNLKITKSMYDVTQSKAPPFNVATGDVIQYTITVTNMGNVNGGGFTIADAVPTGASYVSGSTTMNAVAVADCSGGSFPFATAAAANSDDQSAGSGVLSTNSSAGNPSCVIQYQVTVTASNYNSIVNTATASITGASPSSPITAQGTASFVVGQSTLPVTLIDFTAKQDGAVVKLNWSTANEINNSRFQIERSVDGSYYTTKGTVMAAPTNGDPIHYYSFTDLNPALGNNFYRLKQIDQDGHFTYSMIRNVDFNDLGMNEPTIYPNPASTRESITLSIGSSPQELIVKLMNMAGQLISKQSFLSPNDHVTIDISHLSKGVYYVMAIADTKPLKPVKLIVE